MQELKSGFMGRIASETLGTVVKTIVLVIQALCLTLVLPFHWPTLIGTLLLVGLAYFFFRRARRSNLALFASVLVALGAVVWGSSGPLFLSRAPVYVHFDKNASLVDQRLLDAAIVKLEADGSLITFMDPIRKHLFAPVLELLPMERLGIRVLKEHTIAGKTYIQIPLNRALRLEFASTVGGATTTFIPVSLPFREIRVDGENGRMIGKLTTGFGFASYTVVLSVGSPSPHLSSWDLVHVTEVKPESLRYTALLDLGLDVSIDGETERAVNLLEEASQLAPNNEEQARTSCLLAGYLRRILQGNIGILQSLPLTHRCYRAIEMMKVTPEKSTSLEQWIVRELQLQYLEHGTLFADRIEALSKHVPGQQRISQTQRSRTEFKANLGDQQALDRLLERLKAVNDEIAANRPDLEKALDEQARIGALSPEELRQEIQGTHGPAQALKIELALRALKTRPYSSASIIESKLNILKDEIHTLPSRHVEGYLRRLEWTRAMIYSNMSFANGDVSSYVEGLRTLIASPPFNNRYDRAFVDAITSQKDNAAFPDATDDLSSAFQPWWKNEYQAWVAYRTLQMLSKAEDASIAKAGRLSEADVLAAIGPTRRTIADGTNRPYLPNILFLARLTEREAGKEHKFLVSKLEQALEIKYGDLLLDLRMQPVKEFLR